MNLLTTIPILADAEIDWPSALVIIVAILASVAVNWIIRNR